jgi:hypothetical protein
MALKGQTHTHWCRTCNKPATTQCLIKSRLYLNPKFLRRVQQHEVVLLRVDTPSNVKGVVQ